MVVSSQQRGRYSAPFGSQILSAEKSQSDPHESYQLFFFPKHFVTLGSNKITYARELRTSLALKVSKCFMKKGNLLFSMLGVI